MRNHAPKAAGTIPLCQGGTSVLAALLKPAKRRRARWKEELYQIEFQEKINLLEMAELKREAKASGAAGRSEVEDDLSDVEDQFGMDQPTWQGDAIPARKLREFKVYRMSMRRRVVTKAWDDKSDEVQERLYEAARLEKLEFIVLAAVAETKEPSPLQ